MVDGRSSIEILNERIRKGEDYIAKLRNEGNPFDRSYALLKELKAQADILRRRCPPPIIWETGNMPQMLSVLVLKEADAVRLKAQLTGNPRIDWYAKNQIRNLEGQIANIRRWLVEGGS